MSSVLLLTALGHADPVAALADEAGQRKLVAWLEDTKIRALPLGEREQLRASDSPAWPASFAAYCQQLGCSLPPTPRAAVLDWLLCWAVGLEYRDGAARFTPSQSTLDSDQAKLEQLSLDEQTLTGGARQPLCAPPAQPSDEPPPPLRPPQLSPPSSGRSWRLQPLRCTCSSTAPAERRGRQRGWPPRWSWRRAPRGSPGWPPCRLTSAPALLPLPPPPQMRRARFRSASSWATTRRCCAPLRCCVRAMWLRCGSCRAARMRRWWLRRR